MGLLAMHYDPAISAEELFQAHVAFGKQFPEVPRPRVRPGTKIRVGYVSGDFCSSGVAHFLLPLLENHDRLKFEIFLYSRTVEIDLVTDWFKLQGKWRDLGSDDDLALAMIRADNIDILIDCSGYTSGNSLPLFARRPAPISMTFLGYPDTTGLVQIDYRLSDEISDPPGSLAVEELVRLPNGIHTYRPLIDTSVPVARDGLIVFGNLGNSRKIRKPVLELWKRVVAAIPGATFVVNPNHELTLTQYFATYEKVDIILDTFPYTGTTTVCDALWMGVPVVTLLGDRCCGRAAASLLTRIGLSELIAHCNDDYVRIAVELARDRERLTKLRTNLRSRLLASPLGRPEIIIRDLEIFYVDAFAKEAARA